jgi:hypothetical protein
MKKVYTVVKDGSVEYVSFDKSAAINIAEEVSGVKLKMALASVDIWETFIDTSNTKIVWRVSWEAAGPLEPNIYTPSIAPSMI